MPGISFSFPLTDGLAPTSFTAWGQYDPQDADTTKPARCTMTRNGNATPVDINLRSDGVWTANFSNLATGTNYTADAYYTNKAGVRVNATQETGIEVTTMPLAVPLPPPYIQLPELPAGGVAAAKAAGGVASAVSSEVLCGHPQVIVRGGIYPACLKFHKAVAVVRQQAAPRRIASVLPVLTSFGNWTVLVPAPADYPAVAYGVYVVWVDRNGQQVTQTAVLL